MVTVLRKLLEPCLQIHKLCLDLDNRQGASENPLLGSIGVNSFSRIRRRKKLFLLRAAQLDSHADISPASRSKRLVQ
jgi:hypothetical protein